MSQKRKTLVVVTGPTGSGKTALAIALAQRLDTEIVSADSRQIFKDISIGTAAPTAQELAQAVHHLVGIHPLDQYYSAAEFEQDALRIIDGIFLRSDYAILCGGSMMYVDAVRRGIDELPTISDEVRRRAYALWESEGNEGVMARLRELDPTYADEVDPNNGKRLVHALEICMEAEVPYSTLRTGRAKQRPFRIVTLAIRLPREQLFDRINRRVDAMVTDGLVEESRRVYPLRHLNSLNTVGFKEMFRYIDGEWDLATATARMAKNTRVYAKKQLTWLQRDDSVEWLDGNSATLVEDAVKVIKAEG